MTAATILHQLWAPWGEAIDRRALVELTLLGLSGGALGCWVLLHGLSYSTESLAHGLLPGLVGAALLGLPLLAGGAAGILVAAAAIAAAARVPLIGRDAAIAIAVTGLFGLGSLMALSRDTPVGLRESLFGDVLGVTDFDLVAGGVWIVVLAAALRLLHGRLLVVGFDRGAAPSLGVAPGLVDAGLLALIAVTLLLAVQGLGTLLVIALLVGPAAAARGVTRRVPAMMAVAAAVAVTGAVGGLYLSYYAHTAAGASVAAVILGCVAMLRLSII
jgi:ABC-type Mn2+/Zn2+ transport system permease subunit